MIALVPNASSMEFWGGQGKAKYKESAQEKHIEVGFVSSDQDEAGFQGYFGEMPWLALPFDNKAAKHALSEKS